jgi:hypothetical protein
VADPALRRASSRISRPSSDGRTLLAAGPWATGSPGSLDPSYWAPQAFEGLARFTGDPRWRALDAGARAAEVALTPSGQMLNAETNALPLVAAAAAASAAGDTRGRDRYLAAARAEQAAYPTYYGGAWLALGEGLLDGALGSCAGGGAGT